MSCRERHHERHPSKVSSAPDQMQKSSLSRASRSRRVCHPHAATRRNSCFVVPASAPDIPPTAPRSPEFLERRLSVAKQPRRDVPFHAWPQCLALSLRETRSLTLLSYARLTPQTPVSRPQSRAQFSAFRCSRLMSSSFRHETHLSVESERRRLGCVSRHLPEQNSMRQSPERVRSQPPPRPIILSHLVPLLAAAGRPALT